MLSSIITKILKAFKMIFYPIEQAPGRLNRSELAIPGSQPQIFEKATKLDFDLIFLELEDAVAPDEIENTLQKNITTLNETDWGKEFISF